MDPQIAGASPECQEGGLTIVPPSFLYRPLGEGLGEGLCRAPATPLIKARRSVRALTLRVTIQFEVWSV